MGENYNDGKNGKLKDNKKAYEYYLKAAEMGYREAYWKVGLKYCYGLGTTQNYAEAAKWWKKYCEIQSGSSYVAKKIGDLSKEGGYGLSYDRDEAIRWYRISANLGSDAGKEALREMGEGSNGSSSSSSSSSSSYSTSGKVPTGLTAKQYYDLGENYASGKNGKSKDDVKAFAHFMKAAEMGYVDAYWKVGLEYRYGPGVEVNYAEAVKWWIKYHENRSGGGRYAIKLVGDLYKTGGKGLTANRDEAIRWYRLSASLGEEEAVKALREMGIDPNSSSSSSSSSSSYVNTGGMTAKECYDLAENYNDGKNGYTEDRQKAFQYYLLAAEKGHDFSRFMVGLKYFYGLGVSKNYAEAARWIKAYEADHTSDPTPQSIIADCYLAGGYGLSANRDEAIRWYRKAANNGHDSSKKKLREMGVRVN